MDVDPGKRVSMGLPECMQNIFRLYSKPTLTTVSETRVQIQVAKEMEADRILLLSSFSINNCTYKTSRWKPSETTLLPEWMQLRSRWIRMVGIPKSLRKLETFRGLCDGFGEFSKAEEVAGNDKVVRALVNKCDLIKIPHFLPLIAGEDRYLIQILPKMPE